MSSSGWLEERFTYAALNMCCHSAHRFWAGLQPARRPGAVVCPSPLPCHSLRSHPHPPPAACPCSCSVASQTSHVRVRCALCGRRLARTVGTRKYRPPEMGTEAYTSARPSVDIYSFGVMVRVILGQMEHEVCLLAFPLAHCDNQKASGAGVEIRRGSAHADGAREAGRNNTPPDALPSRTAESPDRSRPRFCAVHHQRRGSAVPSPPTTITHTTVDWHHTHTNPRHGV